MDGLDSLKSAVGPFGKHMNGKKSRACVVTRESSASEDGVQVASMRKSAGHVGPRHSNTGDSAASESRGDSEGSNKEESNDSSEASSDEDGPPKISQQDLSACIHAAEKTTAGRSLKEVREMRVVLQSVNDWVEQCQSLCPRRQSKRRVQPSNKPTFQRLEELMAEGLAFPVDVSDEVERIRKHIAEALSWQINARSVMEKVAPSLAEQTRQRMDLWRKEAEEDRRGLEPKLEDWTPADVMNADAGGECDKRGQDDFISSAIKFSGAAAGDASDTNEQEDGSESNDVETQVDEHEAADEEAIQQLLISARDISVYMPEEMVTERVHKLVEWAR